MTNALKDKLVIGVAGLPGAGKGLVTQVAERMGLDVILMGDEIRDETKRWQLEPTPANMGKLMLKLRQKEGPAVIAKRCVPKIKKMKNNVVIVDGVRSLDEVNEFKKHFSKFKLLAIHSSQETRFKRLYKRRRSDDPTRWSVFLERDQRELHVGLGNTIACADLMVVNEGSEKDLREKAQNVLENMSKNGVHKHKDRSQS